MTRVMDVWRPADSHVKIRFMDGNGTSVKYLSDAEASALMTELAALNGGGESDE